MGNHSATRVERVRPPARPAIRGIRSVLVKSVAFIVPLGLVLGPLALSAPGSATAAGGQYVPAASVTDASQQLDASSSPALSVRRDKYTIEVPAPAKVASSSSASLADMATGAPATGAPNPAAAQAIAAKMVAARGWGADQMSCLTSLWNKESGWNVYAYNPSGAYGIPQSLPGSKMATAGSDWQTNPATQITWGLTYIAAVYGNPCGAWGHSQAFNSY